MNTELCAKLASVETDLKQIKTEITRQENLLMLAHKPELKKFLEESESVESDRFLVVLEEMARLIKLKKGLMEQAAAKQIILSMLQRHQDDCLLVEDDRQKRLAEIKLSIEPAK